MLNRRQQLVLDWICFLSQKQPFNKSGAVFQKLTGCPIRTAERTFGELALLGEIQREQPKLKTKNGKLTASRKFYVVSEEPKHVLQDRVVCILFTEKPTRPIRINYLFTKMLCTPSQAVEAMEAARKAGRLSFTFNAATRLFTVSEVQAPTTVPDPIVIAEPPRFRDSDAERRAELINIIGGCGGLVPRYKVIAEKLVCSKATTERLVRALRLEGVIVGTKKQSLRLRPDLCVAPQLGHAPSVAATVPVPVVQAPTTTEASRGTKTPRRPSTFGTPAYDDFDDCFSEDSAAAEDGVSDEDIEAWARQRNGELPQLMRDYDLKHTPVYRPLEEPLRPTVLFDEAELRRRAEVEQAEAVAQLEERRRRVREGWKGPRPTSAVREEMIRLLMAPYPDDDEALEVHRNRVALIPDADIDEAIDESLVEDPGEVYLPWAARDAIKRVFGQAFLDRLDRASAAVSEGWSASKEEPLSGSADAQPTHVTSSPEPDDGELHIELIDLWPSF